MHVLVVSSCVEGALAKILDGLVETIAILCRTCSTILDPPFLTKCFSSLPNFPIKRSAWAHEPKSSSTSMEWQQTESWRRGPAVAGYGPLTDHAGVGGLRLDLTDEELQPWDPPCGAQRWMAPVHRNQSEPRASQGRTEQRLFARAALAHGLSRPRVTRR